MFWDNVFTKNKYCNYGVFILCRDQQKIIVWLPVVIIHSPSGRSNQPKLIHIFANKICIFGKLRILNCEERRCRYETSTLFQSRKYFATEYAKPAHRNIQNTIHQHNKQNRTCLNRSFYFLRVKKSGNSCQ